MNNRLKNKRIVCLGGGVGTSNLIHGLAEYSPHITVVTSMADDGGSSGRLRRIYKMLPPGDLVSCIAAMQSEHESYVSKLLTFRFPGERHGVDDSLGGHKLGNLIMAAAYHITGDFGEALEMTKKMFGVTADILPATLQRVRLSAVTKSGKKVHGETTLDLAKYVEPYGFKKVYLTPSKPTVNPKVLKALKNADVIISGPGDLYTNQLPVLLIPEIKEAVIKSKAKKIFVLNVANKPFETKGFKLREFIDAFEEHLGTFPFKTVIANNTTTFTIPKKYKYKYINTSADFKHASFPIELILRDVVKDAFPLYHDSTKLAQAVSEAV